MDYRTQAFTDKFNSALGILAARSARDIVSLKFRDSVNHSEYTHLIDFLRDEFMFEVKSLSGNFQGHAWLVTDEAGNEAILVEHETGLELLYIAGSVASIISLIPVIDSAWKFLRNRFGHRPMHHSSRADIEIRRLSPKNVLIERKIISIGNYVLSINHEENKKLSGKVNKLEKQISDLQKIVQENRGDKSKDKRKTTKSKTNPAKKRQ